MRRAAYLIAGAAMLLASSGQAATSTPNLSAVAAGRVRFIDGAGGQMTFQGSTVAPDIDFLALVGATFRTNQSRLELQILNGDLFWFDRNSEFHFEASDPKGDQTTLFLGTGSFVVRTEAPFALISGAGSVLLPGGGTYSVSKDEPGKARITVGTVAGPEPTVIKQSGLFSKIVIGNTVNSDLVAWSRQRDEDWNKTLGRADIFSNVDKMPPMLAYTDANGTTQWERVATVRPIWWTHGSVRDNLFLWKGPWVTVYGFLRAASLVPAGFAAWTDYDTGLWFMSSWYNSLRWAWSVPLGWHAEWYWDPLAGFGAEYDTAFYFSPCGPWGGLCPYPGWSWWDWTGQPNGWHPPQPVDTGVPRPVLRGPMTRIAERPVVVRLDERSRVRDRLLTDPGLRSDKQARHLDVSPAAIVRARLRGPTRLVEPPPARFSASRPVWTVESSTPVRTVTAEKQKQ